MKAKIIAAFSIFMLTYAFSLGQKNDLEPGCNLKDKNYTNMILSGTSMYGSFVQNSDFSGSVMVNCQLQHSNFFTSVFNKVNFAYADLTSVEMGPGTKVLRANFDGANLEMAHFRQVQMDSCMFTSTTNLTRASFDSCSLRNAVFKGVNLKHTSFEYADLTNAIFIDVILDSTIFKHANLQGAYFYGAKENQFSLFGNANMSNSAIFNSHFEKSSFTSAQIQASRIENTMFNNSDIMSADFSGSIIKNCDFSGAQFNATGGLFFDGVDDIVTVEAPGSISGASGAFSIEMAIVPQNQKKVSGLASFNHRSRSLKNLFEIFLDDNFHLVFQYKIADEKVLHTVISNDTLSGNAYNLIMITYNKGDVKFYLENKPMPTKSVYFSYSGDEYMGKSMLTETPYSPKPDETIEANTGNLILGGFSGIYPVSDVIADSTCAAMAMMYYRFWSSAIDTDGKLSQLYPLQTNENGETGYPFYYQSEEAPETYSEGLKSNIVFFNSKEQLIKDSKAPNVLIYKGAGKEEDDKDPLYHIVNKNFENTLIENTTMFFGW